VALLVIAAGILLLGGGEDDGDPVGSVDQTTTPTSTPTTPAVVTTVPADPTESPTATETQIAAAPPEVGPITALLLAPITSYTVEASSPAGLELSYRWSLVADPGQDCGRKLPSGFGTSTVDLSTVQWSHANEAPDGCHHDAPDHPFTIEVEVSDGVNPPILRTYRGSNSGVGPVP